MGWIKLHTKITEWRWWRDLPTRAVWLEILVRANWKDTEWGKTVIPRGSFVTSREHLADLCGLSVMQVRRALDNLQSTGEINRQITNKYTIIKVCKYDDYQVLESTTQPTNNQQTTSEVGQTIQRKPTKTLAEIDEELRERARAFAETLKPYVGIYGRQMVKDFWDYWTEPNKSHTRMRFELERTWDVSRRLDRWSRNNNNMGRTPTTTNGSPQQPESRYAAAAAQAERMKQYLEPEQQQETIEEYERRQLERLSEV